jgi:hypothetical protein
VLSGVGGKVRSGFSVFRKQILHRTVSWFRVSTLCSTALDAFLSIMAISKGGAKIKKSKSTEKWAIFSSLLVLFILGCQYLDSIKVRMAHFT